MNSLADIVVRACPFCGGQDEFNPSVSRSYRFVEPGDPEQGTTGNLAAGTFPSGHYVECDKCGSCGADKPTEAEAIAAWNTRTDPLAALVLEAREAATDTLGHLSWIVQQGESAMSISAGCANTSGDPEGALEMLNSTASDIAINAQMAIDKLSATLAKLEAL